MTGGKRVVLVEGHALLRAVLAMRLDQEPDFEVTALCGSLADARDVDFRKCDAAIVDIFLPDGNGTDLIRELHDAIPRSIPAIALIGSQDPEVCAEASRAGANEVLTKGVGFDNIIGALRRILEGA